MSSGGTFTFGATAPPKIEASIRKEYDDKIAALKRQHDAELDRMRSEHANARKSEVRVFTTPHTVLLHRCHRLPRHAVVVTHHSCESRATTS